MTVKIEQNTEKTTEKVIIIGSGPAGLTAALYASRAGLSPLVIDGERPGGQLMTTTYIENWPGNQRILGSELMMNMRAHAESFGTRFESGKVVSVDFSIRPFTIKTSKNRELSASSIIIATGSSPKKLMCPGEDTYWARGVSTCAVCDGAFFRDKKVVVVGGGDTALEDASFLTNFTKDITLVYMPEKLTASHAMQKRLLKHSFVKLRAHSTISAIEGDNSKITHVIITNAATGIQEQIQADAVFVAIGVRPNTESFKNQLDLTDYGFIREPHPIHPTHTSVAGVFAAGDVLEHAYKQAITAASSGCMAALEVEKFLNKLT